MIPGDKGGTWRLDKFVEYQHYAPAVDPLTYVEYAKRNQLNKDECVALAWYHSLTYCELTAALLLEELNFESVQLDRVEEFWKRNKPRLIFGSARKYVKNMDWFVPLMDKWLEDITFFDNGGNVDRKPYVWLKNMAFDPDNGPKQRYKNIEKYLGKWKFMGRFSIDLFTEAIIAMNKAGLIPLEIENSGYDWNKTSNLTSGMLNILYNDTLADKFDKGEYKVDSDMETELNIALGGILQKVRNTYPNQKTDKVSVVNKICSFRNLFKKSRYGGFHHDRQLGNLWEYWDSYPEKSELWNEFFEIRKAIFPRHMLGEYNNWTGIRKERKKIWVERGMTGVEVQHGTDNKKGSKKL